MKHKCPACEEEKDESEFSKRADGRVRPCRDCDRSRLLLKRYGVTMEDYLAMKERQKDKCLICDLKAEELVVDHSHSTNKIRGLLCHSCNLVLGKMKDNIGLFCMAIKYLNEARE